MCAEDRAVGWAVPHVVDGRLVLRFEITAVLHYVDPRTGREFFRSLSKDVGYALLPAGAGAASLG